MKREKDVNIVERILLACLDAGLPESEAKKIEQSIYSEFGGQRFYIAKKKQLSDDVKREVFKLGLKSKYSQEIVKEYGIARASLYRMMKLK